MAVTTMLKSEKPSGSSFGEKTGCVPFWLADE